MLGTEIAIPVCVLDYYNHSVNSIHFLVESETHQNYFISGSKNVPKNVLISCDLFERVSTIGNRSLSIFTSFSITITLNTAL